MDQRLAHEKRGLNKGAENKNRTAKIVNILICITSLINQSINRLIKKIPADTDATRITIANQRLFQLHALKSVS